MSVSKEGKTVYKVYFYGLEVYKTKDRLEAFECAEFYANDSDCAIIERIQFTKDGKVHSFYMCQWFIDTGFSVWRIY